MNTTTISATELKNRVSEVINRVHFGDEEVVVTKTGKPFVRISPFYLREENKSKEYRKKLLDKYFGILPDFPDVTKMRIFRKRKISL